MQIEEPNAAALNKPDLHSFLSLGFRPLYIGGCAWAVVSIAIWIYAPQTIGLPMFGVTWHAHEMLWGFVATIAVAFLLTASATWTKHNPAQGRFLALLCLLWAVARIGYLIQGDTVFLIAAFSESAFFLLSALGLMRVMLKGKSKRNYGIPLLVFGLGAANVLYLHTLRGGDYATLMHYFNLGLVCMAVIALLIARRVIPFFAMRAVPGLQLPMLTRSGQAQMVFGALAIALGLLRLDILMGIALAVAGALSLFQLIKWKPLSVAHNPLLWILYLGYGLMGFGLIFAAAHAFGLSAPLFARAATHVHIIGMGGFSVLIIGMVTRTALGHLGRPLKLDQSMIVSYYFMFLAVVLRLAALGTTSSTQMLLHAAAASWIIAFALYLWRFTPMLVRPRADARPL